jgi:hypothetical protein
VKNGATTIDLDYLITAALKNEPHNARRLHDAASRYALRLSKAKAPDLPDDLHEEIYQEAQCRLAAVGATGLARRSGKELFRRAVLAAIRVVRAQNAPPGSRTRWTSQPQSAPDVAAEDIGRVADVRELERCSRSEPTGVVIDFDKFPDRTAMQAFRQVEIENDLLKVLKAAPAPVGDALRQIYLEGMPVGTVAVWAKMDRFTLNRRIKAFTSSMRAAA